MSVWLSSVTGAPGAEAPAVRIRTPRNGSTGGGLCAPTVAGTLANAISKRTTGRPRVLRSMTDPFERPGGNSRDAASVENVSKCYGESDKAAWELNEVGGRT